MTDASPTSHYKVELRLAISTPHHRQLDLQLSQNDHLWASLELKRVFLGSANAPLAQCYLSTAGDYPFLCIATACLQVSQKEITQIRAAFEPHGLRVQGPRS